MSHQKPAHHQAVGVFALLAILLIFTGCGLTSSNKLADDSDPDAAAARTLAAAHDEEIPSDESSSDPVVEDLNPPNDDRATERTSWEIPDALGLEMPPIPLGPIIPVSSRGASPTEASQQPSAPPAAHGQPTADSPPAPDSHGSLTPSPAQGLSAAQSAPRSVQKVEKVSTEDFQQVVLESDVPVIVNFYADWCGPCKTLSPLLDNLARERSDVRVVKVNIDHDRALQRQYKVRSVPTVIIFHEGNLVAQHTGVPNIKKALGH